MVRVRGKRLIHSLILVMIAVGVVACGGEQYTEGPRPQPEPSIEYRAADDARFYASYQHMDAKGSILPRVINVKLNVENVLTRDLPIELFYRGNSYKNQITILANKNGTLTEYGTATMAETSYSSPPYNPIIRVEPSSVVVYENEKVSNKVYAQYLMDGVISFSEFSSTTPVNTTQNYILRVDGDGFSKHLDVNIVPPGSWTPVTSMVVQNADGKTISATNEVGTISEVISLSGGEFADELLPSGHLRVFYGEDNTATPPVLPPSNPDVIITNSNPQAFNTSLVYIEGEGYFLDIIANATKQKATISLQSFEKATNGTPLASQVLRINTHYGLSYPTEKQYLPTGIKADDDVVFTFDTRNIPEGATVLIEEVAGEGETDLFTISGDANKGVRTDAENGDKAMFTFTLKAKADLADGDTTTLKAAAYFADGTTPLNGADGKPLTSSVDAEVLAVTVVQETDTLTSASSSCSFDAYPVAVVAGYKKGFTTASIVGSVAEVVLSDADGNQYDTEVVRVDLDSGNLVTAVDADIASSGALVCLQDKDEVGKILPSEGVEVSGSLKVEGAAQTVAATTITPTVNIGITNPEPLSKGETAIVPIRLGVQYIPQTHALKLVQADITDASNILNLADDGMPYLAFGGDIAKKSQASRTGPLVVTAADTLPDTSATATIPVYVTIGIGGTTVKTTKVVTITSKGTPATQ